MTSTSRYLEPLRQALADVKRQLRNDWDSIPDCLHTDEKRTAIGGRFTVRFGNSRMAAMLIKIKLAAALKNRPPRKPKINRRRPIPVAYKCHGGPFEGERIFLSDYSLHGPVGTLPFMGGRYVQIPAKPGIWWQADAG